jgi:hypothetical protein
MAFNSSDTGPKQKLLELSSAAAIPSSKMFMIKPLGCSET